jgi:hypothetical protein
MTQFLWRSADKSIGAARRTTQCLVRALETTVCTFLHKAPSRQTSNGRDIGRKEIRDGRRIELSKGPVHRRLKCNSEGWPGNPFTGCLFVESRPVGFSLLLFGGAQSAACDFQSVTCRAPLKNKKEGVGGVSAINRQPRWGFEKGILCSL